MTRIALLSDVHADVHALRDALALIDRLACDVIVCGGDVVDFGLFPIETIALLASRQIPTVCGNHDAWAIGSIPLLGVGGAWADEIRESRESMKWLRSLPASWAATFDGVRVAVHHGSPRGGNMVGIDPTDLTRAEAIDLLDAADTDVLIVGHTHRAFEVVVEGRGAILNPAALLRDPAEGAENPPATATFGILELPAIRFTIHSVRDGETRSATCRTLREAGGR
jgi:predicted phosphodiesterase